MQIVGEVAHPRMKITIFKTSTRFPVKFEIGNFEQTYKFRLGDAVNNLQDVKKLLDETFIDEVENSFATMFRLNRQVFDRFIQDTRHEFEDIV